MVEDYVMMLKKEVGPNSIGSYMAGIEAFFETNDVELRWKKIRRLYPAKVKKTGGRIWTTEEIAATSHPEMCEGFFQSGNKYRKMFLH